VSDRQRTKVNVMSWMMTVWWSTEWFICLPRRSPL
jgi:hypothetical protein